MAKHVHHTLDVYDVELYLVTSPKGWKRLRKQLPFMDKGADSAGASQFAIWHPNSGIACGHLVLYVDVGSHSTVGELVQTIAHEATHGAGSIMGWIQHDACGGDNEPHAYLVGWLTRWVSENVDLSAIIAA